MTDPGESIIIEKSVVGRETWWEVTERNEADKNIQERTR